MTLDEAFVRLEKSKFRSCFKLTAADRAYVERVGMETIRRHAADFVRDKLSAAEPVNDGKQTPMRGHPAFKAMHATACCCRGCMEKRWKVSRGKELTSEQQSKAVNLIVKWIERNRGMIDAGNCSFLNPIGIQKFNSRT